MSLAVCSMPADESVDISVFVLLFLLCRKDIDNMPCGLDLYHGHVLSVAAPPDGS